MKNLRYSAVCFVSINVYNSILFYFVSVSGHVDTDRVYLGIGLSLTKCQQAWSSLVGMQFPPHVDDVEILECRVHDLEVF